MKDHFTSTSFDLSLGMSAYDYNDVKTKKGIRLPESSEMVLDVSKWLPLAAKSYHISPDLHDYLIFPVVSIVSELPNTNGDSVSRAELLKFNPEYGVPAFMTWRGKPTFVEHCFPGSTVVLTISGSKRIDKINIGDRVCTHDGFGTVERVYNSGVANVSLITTDFGTIQATSNHPFLALVKNSKTYDYIKLESLKVGDSLLMPLLKNIYTVSESCATVLGAYFYSTMTDTKLNTEALVPLLDKLNYKYSFVPYLVIQDLVFDDECSRVLELDEQSTAVFIKSFVSSAMSYYDSDLEAMIYTFPNKESAAFLQQMFFKLKKYSCLLKTTVLLFDDEKSHSLVTVVDEKYLAIPILEIHPDVGSMNVYNLQIGPQATFTANNFVVHNCNTDITKANGIILDTYLQPIRQFTGNHIKLVKLLAFDSRKDPSSCSKIRNKLVNTTSMGMYYSSFICSLCGNAIGKGFGKLCNHTQPKRKTYMEPYSNRLVYRMCQNVVGFECSLLSTYNDPAFVNSIFDFDHILHGV